MRLRSRNPGPPPEDVLPHPTQPSDSRGETDVQELSTYYLLDPEEVKQRLFVAWRYQKGRGAQP